MQAQNIWGPGETSAEKPHTTHTAVTLGFRRMLSTSDECGNAPYCFYRDSQRQTSSEKPHAVVDLGFRRMLSTWHPREGTAGFKFKVHWHLRRAYSAYILSMSTCPPPFHFTPRYDASQSGSKRSGQSRRLLYLMILQ